MRPKGGTFFFLLIVACVTLAQRPGDGGGKQGKKQGLRGISKKLMAKCLNKGHTMPELTELKEIFNTSDLLMVDPNSKQMDIFLSRFLKVMQSSEPRRKGSKPDKMEKMWNCSNLPAMISLIRNSSEEIACYMRAYVAPFALKAFTSHRECNMTSEDYDALLWAFKPLLKDKDFNIMDLPFDIDTEIIKKIFRATPKQKWKKVLQWGKEHITQKYFNCTTRPPSDSVTKGMKQCEPSVPWLNSEALAMIGPAIFGLRKDDIKHIVKDELCTFLFNDGFKNAAIERRKTKNKPIPPSLSDAFWNKVQDCFNGKNELAENVDKLSILACKYVDGPSLSPNMSLKLLSDLSICKQLKKRIIRSQIAKGRTKDLLKWGPSIRLLSPRQIQKLSDRPRQLEEVAKKNLEWTLHQQLALAKTVCRNKCKDLSGPELMEHAAIAGGLPPEAFYKVNEVVDTEDLRKLCKKMKKKQLCLVLRLLSQNMTSQQLVDRMPGRLLCALSLNKMDNVSFTPEVQEKTWCRTQAAFIAERMFKGPKKRFRGKKLRSLLRGVSCEWIKNVSDSEAKEMAWDITEAPEWLSKKQAGCVAQKLFRVLEKERANYFKNATIEELEKIPTLLLYRLPPKKVNDLPDTLCPVLLSKMEDADLSTSPRRSRSRSALTKRALSCLANGKNLSSLTFDQVFSLGPFMCELQASQLRLMAPDVRNSSLLAMTSCENIPERNRDEIIELVVETFGNPSMSQETMEEVGYFILLDDKAIADLPDKCWMKEVLIFLTRGRKKMSIVLKEKLFNLTTNCETNRYTRAADFESITLDYIEELGMENGYWRSEELDRMSDDTLRNTIEIFGAIPDLSEDQLAVLSRKAKVLSETGDSNVSQLGCILRGYNSTELEEFPLSLDDLEVIADCNWNKAQVKAIWKAVARTNNLTVQTLEANTLVSLTRFICGLSPSEIQQLSEDAFRYAVGLIDVSQCSFEVLEQFKIRAVSAFGSPKTWSEARVSELGCIVAGLNANELASLDPSVFSIMNESCIPLITPNSFAALSVEQLEALSPESADLVTDEQKDALGDEQMAALERASTGAITLAQKSTLSGAPSLSAEGIAAFMKPLLFLLMGFLLL